MLSSGARDLVTAPLGRKNNMVVSMFLIASLIPFLPSFPFLSLYSISGFFDTMCQVWSETVRWGWGASGEMQRKGEKIENDTKDTKTMNKFRSYSSHNIKFNQRDRCKTKQSKSL